MRQRGTVESGRQAPGDRRMWIVVALAVSLVLAAAWYYRDIARFAQGIYDTARLSLPVQAEPPTPAPVGPSEPVQEAPLPSAETVAAAESPAEAKPPPELPPLPRLFPVEDAAPPPPEGRAGLVVLLRSGALRPASGTDMARWKSRHAEINGRSPGREFDERLGMFPAYVVTGNITIPSGLAGAHSVIFLLEPGAPYPAGDPGHSLLLDMASGSCIGATCRMLLE